MIDTTQNVRHGIFFSCSAGGGHDAVKQALQQEKTEEYRKRNIRLDTTTYDVDFMRSLFNTIQLPFLGGLGDFGIRQWNNAQKQGNLTLLRLIPRFDWLLELILYPFAYFKVRQMLLNMQEKPEFFVYTHAPCINAIAQAVLSVNRERGWDTKVDVYLTDMPSKRAIHFFPAIQRAVNASAEVRDIIRLHSPEPLCTDKNAFWQRYCPNVTVVTDEHYPVRKAFLQTDELKEQLAQDVIELSLDVHDGCELKLTTQYDLSITPDRTTLTVPIGQEDKVAFLMLGSQPTTRSVLNWLDRFVKASAKVSTGTRQHFLFLYCGAPHSENNRNRLLDAVSGRIKELIENEELPYTFQIVPFTHQPPERIALLMARANLRITRSGGATTMEILSLFENGVIDSKNTKTIIHSEARQYTHRTREAERRLHDVFRSTVPGREGQPLTQPELTEEKKKTMEDCTAALLRVQGYTRHASVQVAQDLVANCFHDTMPWSDGVSNFKRNVGTILGQIRAQNRLATYRETLNEMQRQLPRHNYPNEQAARQSILLREGTFHWERENAEYLIRKVAADVLNPEMARRTLKDFFA